MEDKSQGAGGGTDDAARWERMRSCMMFEFIGMMAESMKIFEKYGPAPAINYLENKKREYTDAAEPSIGISFMPDMKLSQVPVTGSVPAGDYVTSKLVVVEVVGQDPKTGRVTFEVPIPDTNGKLVATLDGEVFKQLFEHVPPVLATRAG